MKINLPVTNAEADYDTRQMLLSTTDLKGRIVHLNDAFVAVSGYKREAGYLSVRVKPTRGEVEAAAVPSSAACALTNVARPKFGTKATRPAAAVH